ncbi:hypothetical protein [Streptomyces sp. NBC_00239]|uniref:hypothetical protein n=1 Tax=Streptomyces sp. NBC_00239 TaxID=2903640 RepID=UPI002E287317|nr:hypothetical protein [Streptomyces sp. NBC_00239]
MVRHRHGQHQWRNRTGPAQASGPALKNGDRLGLGALASYSTRTVNTDLALIRYRHATHTTACHHCTPT